MNSDIVNGFLFGPMPPFPSLLLIASGLLLLRRHNV